MRIDHPTPGCVPGLCRLWKEVFADAEKDIALFFDRAFHPRRCLCALEEDRVTGMIYWLPCSLEGRSYAYIYALGVAAGCRGRGIARELINAAHRLLAREGWAGVLLMPQEESLREMYRKFGYETTCFYAEEIIHRDDPALSLRQISGSEYALLREKALAPGGVSQGDPFFSLMEPQIRFYRGEDCLLAIREEPDHLYALEALGSAARLPGVPAALGKPWGRFRMPGSRNAGAMYKPLDPDAPVPAYFAFELM